MGCNYYIKIIIVILMQYGFQQHFRLIDTINNVKTVWSSTEGKYYCNFQSSLFFYEWLE